MNVITNDRPLRVAHVSLGLDMGGLEKLLVEFARHTDRERFQLRFVSLTTRGALASDLEACGWPVEALADPGGLRASLVFQLARRFRRWDIDVVHTHDERPLLYGGLAARLAGARLIHTRHGQKARNPRRQVFLFRLAAGCARRMIAVSNDSARLTVKEGVPPQKVRTIRNGIDLTRFAFSGPTPGGPVVTVARLSPEKGIDTLLHAAARLLTLCPDFRLEIAGDGRCSAELKTLHADLGLGVRVKFLGEVRDVPALLARASLFVLPSNEEGISLTLLEAMARGLPVVATRVGGTPEVLSDSKAGVIVPCRDPEALAQAMHCVLADQELSQHMGREGRRRVEDAFDVRRMVAEYEALYLEQTHPAYEAEACAL
jgi:glycosyltransferase involved in cell wall biosynthesis